jgi:suppressor for copper-sensitivity B
MTKLSIFTLLVCLLIPFQAHAGKDTFKNDLIRAQLTMVNIHGMSPTKGALEVFLDNGWHTYWRAPGDTGLPPVLSWEESENIKNVKVHWEIPERKVESGLNVFAYTDVMTLPLVIALEDPEKEAVLDLKAQIMICKDICIPQKFELTVPYKPQKRELEQLRTHFVITPKGEQLESVRIGSAVAGEDKLIINVAGDQGFEGLDIFPVIEDENLALAAPSEIQLIDDNPEQAMVIIPVNADIENFAQYLKGKTVSLTIVHDGNAAEYKVSY